MNIMLATNLPVFTTIMRDEQSALVQVIMQYGDKQVVIAHFRLDYYSNTYRYSITTLKGLHSTLDRLNQPNRIGDPSKDEKIGVARMYESLGTKHCPVADAWNVFRQCLKTLVSVDVNQLNVYENSTDINQNARTIEAFEGLMSDLAYSTVEKIL